MTENTTASGAADRVNAYLDRRATMRSVDPEVVHGIDGPDFELTVSDLRALAASAPVAPTFQQRVKPWMMECFGPEISADRNERNHRFFEESTELVQAGGMTRSEAYQLVDYVFGRPVGEPAQEVGGVMVTLAALCLANGLDMHTAAETELARIWTKVVSIRAKQAAKPKHSPLPEAAPVAPAPQPVGAGEQSLRNAFGVWAETQGNGEISLLDVLSPIEAEAAFDNWKLTLVAAAPQPADRWRERWYGSGGVSGFQGWSIVNDRTNALVAYLYSYVSSEAVSEIVMAHNNALLAARGTTQAAPAMDAKQLGDAVVKWLGCETTKPRGDTGEPERRIDVSVERLGFAVAAVLKTVTAPAPVAEDAANWHWLASYLVGPRTDLDDEIVASESVNALRKLVSAARAQAAQPEGGANANR